MCPHGDWDRRRPCQLAGCAGDAMNWADWRGDGRDIRQLRSREQEDLDIIQELEAGEVAMVPRSEKGVAISCKQPGASPHPAEAGTGGSLHW